VTAVQPDLFVPDGQLYRCISMDPPWEERGGGKCVRGAQRHYPLVKTKDLPGVILGSGRFTPDPAGAHLWMWVTDNFLTDGLWLIDQLGFHYIRTFVWVKLRDVSPMGVTPCEVARDALQIGLGQYGRGAHELLLLSTRGQALVPPPERRPPSVFFAPRTRHSAKPDQSYSLIEQVSPGPRLELFARSDRAGWDSWGNEVTQ